MNLLLHFKCHFGWINYESLNVGNFFLLTFFTLFVLHHSGLASGIKLFVFYNMPEQRRRGMRSLELFEPIALYPLTFLPLLVMASSSFFSIFHFPCQQIHQFISSLRPQFFEDLFCFVIRSIRVLLRLIKSCFFSHSHIMSLHVVLKPSCKLAIAFSLMFLQFLRYLCSMCLIDGSNSLALLFSRFVCYHIWPHPDL